MRLLFDIGNTRIKWVLEKSEGFESGGVVTHAAFDMSEVERCLAECKHEILEVWACSVASELLEQRLSGWVAAFLSKSINWAAVERSCAGVVNCYDDLTKLGVDRWMAVLGANHYRLKNKLLDCSVVIVDAGTAVTVELLSVAGRYEGGVIMPGLRLMHDVLVGQTEGIASTLVGSASVLGRNTQAGVNSGVRLGLVGAVERVVQEILSLSSVAGSEVLVLLTGGDASFIGESSNLNYKIEPQLVLSGLVCVANGGERE